MKTKMPAVTRIKSRLVLAILIAILVIVFILMIIPNSKGSTDLAMVSMLEPDEGVVIPVMQKMIRGGKTLRQALIHFIAYDYYFYGLPYFGFGAFVLLILRKLGLDGSFSNVMVILRQMVTVLPALTGVAFLTYLQDQFKSWKSWLLCLALILIPGFVRNMLWLHPDGLVLAFSSLILLLLWRDQAKLERNFYWAAILTGVLTATKLVGAYFFLTILFCLAWNRDVHHGSWGKIAIAAGKFIFLMALSFLISNPFLFSSYGREAYIATFQAQTQLLREGYGVVYPKGLPVALPGLESNYGSIWFLVGSILISCHALSIKDLRFKAALVLTWFIPLGITVLFLSHFKYQYFLPIALPMIANYSFLFEHSFWKRKPQLKIFGWPVAVLIFVVYVGFVSLDAQIISGKLEILNNRPEISFYQRLAERTKSIAYLSLKVYYDYRLYMPETGSWQTETSYDLLDYNAIQRGEYQMLLLSNQRVRDYLQEGLTGIDARDFQAAQTFYRDVQNNHLQGFHLLYEDETAKLFISKTICEEYYKKSENCQQ